MEETGTMEDMSYLLIFSLDGQGYALYLAAVERVARSVYITPLPKAPDSVLGIINAGGEIIPVFDIRKRFGLPSRETRLSDQIIIAQTSSQKVALVVDEAGGVIEITAQKVIGAATVLPGMEYVEGVAKLENGMVLIHDLNTFLSLEEQKGLDDALREIK
jgi:purine-binding chemotaxis protein CheW